MVFQGSLGIFTARNRVREELGLGFQLVLKPSELLFQDEGRIPIELLAPRGRDQLEKAFLMDPEGDEPKGNGP